MNHSRVSSLVVKFSLLVLLPLSASAAPKDPCKQMQRDLDQQIDDLKAWQQLDLEGCNQISGRNSDECRRLKDQHAHDLRAYRDNRTTQMASCRGYRPTLTAASSSENSNND